MLGNLPNEMYENFYRNPHFQGNRLNDTSKGESLERKYYGKI